MSAAAPAPDPAVPAAWSAVVVNWNGVADLPACLAALAAQTWPSAEVVVVDNASADDSLAVLAGYPTVRVIASPINLGFAGGANAGIQATGGALVATLNPDVTLDPDWAAALRDAFAADGRLGAAGGKLLYSDGATVQHAGGRIEPATLTAENIGRGEPDRGQYDAPAEVAFLTGGALLLRRAALDAVGRFDERFNPAYYEDVDLCARLRAGGWGVRYLPAARGLHREGAASVALGAATYRLIHAGRLRYAAKHLPLPELVGRFLPAEAARLSVAVQHLDGPTAVDQAGLSVYPAALLAAPGAMPSDLTRPQRVRDGLAEVGRRWLVEERPFASAAPLVGGLIVRLRTWLNDLGPRWHVRAILAQQVEFNAAVSRALADATAEAQAAGLADQASAALLAEQIEALVAGQAALLARLEALERQLASRTDAPGDGVGGG